MSRIQDLTQSYHSATIQYLSVLQICCARLIRHRRSGTVGLTLRSLFTENRRSDKRIFQFISWLRVGEAEEVPLAEAVRVARREFPRPAGQHPDVCLVLSHAHRVQINEPTHDQRPADDASLARAAAGGRRRQGGQGRLRANGRGGRGARHAGWRAAVLPRRAAAPHAALPRHHLRKLPGADAPRPGVVAGREHAALQPAAPLRRGQPGY